MPVVRVRKCPAVYGLLREGTSRASWVNVHLGRIAIRLRLFKAR